MEINKIITKIRFKLNDSNEIKFSDYDVLQAINESYKQYREICMQEAPSFLTVVREGTTETDVILVSDVAEIIELRTTDRVLKAKRKLPLDNASGEPTMYSVGVNGNALCLYLYPAPTKEFEYKLLCIEQIKDLTKDDVIDIPNELVNCIIELSVSALNGNPQGYIDTEEQIRTILRRYIPLRDFVESYY
jgi:hypothetical protein